MLRTHCLRWALNKMNVLFLIGSYSSFGGTERITTVLANALAKEGRVHIAAFREKCDPQKLGLDAVVKCHELGRRPAKALRKILIEQQIDVIVNQWCLPFYVTLTINRARKGLHVRLVSALHGVPHRSKVVIRAEDAVRSARGLRKVIAALKLWAVEKVVKASIRFVYRQSDAYVVLSKGFLRTFRDYTGISDCSKLVAISNPITIETDYVHDYSGEKRNQILYVGRMDKENKRVNRIVEAWEAVSGQHPDWELVLVGDGPHLEELKETVAERRIPRVTFTGFVDGDLRDYYRHAAIFMLTSDLEGFGLVIVEAMSYGVVPIVYGSYVSVYDIIDSDVNGIITPIPYSQEKTVAALEKLMDNPEKRKKMSVLAREKSKNFELLVVLAQWKNVLSAKAVPSRGNESLKV